MITNNESRKISGNMLVEHEKYTVTDGNLIKLVQQAICAYKNPVMSVVREYVVNGRDAMKLHGITTPIEVTTPSMLKPVLTIRDFGGGMTEEETRNLLFSFGASGHEKQVSNRYVGGFGIGSKSAFNLSDSFLFSVFYQGTKTTWNCMLDKEQFPTAAKMSSVKTDEPDGVLVTIPKKDINLDEVEFALKWLDVPVKLNGTLVKSYKEDSKMNGTAISRNKDGDKLEILWNVVSKSTGNEIVFVVGCGAIGVQAYRLPSQVYRDISIPGYLSSKLVIELPIGSTTLMTSREDFVYNDRTCFVIKNAIRDVINSVHDKIMEEIYQTTDTPTMISKLAELRELYDGHGFNTIVESCIKKIRDKTNLNEFKELICKEIDLSENSGIEGALLTYPTRGGRSYSYDYKYRTSNLLTGKFEGTFSPGGPWIWHAKDSSMWRDGFISEFSELASGRKIMAGPPSASDKSKKLIFEGLSWDNMEIRIYPKNTKKFVGLVREYVTSTNSVDKSSPMILSLCGDVDKLRDELVPKFPGAEVSYHLDVEKFKYKHNRNGSGERKRYERRRLLGWIAMIESDSPHIDSQDGILRTLLSKYKTRFVISNKTSFRELEDAEKPVFYINVEDPDDRNDEHLQKKLRLDVINLLLSNADVYKDKNGLPVIAMIHQQYAMPPPDIGVKFINKSDLEKQRGEISPDIRDRYAMWLYRRLVGDLQEEKWNGSELIDIGHLISQGGLRTYNQMLAEIKTGAPLLTYIVAELAGKRLNPTVRQNVNLINLLFTPVKNPPYIGDPSFSREFIELSSKFVTAYKELVKGIPLVSSFMSQVSPYSNTRIEWLKSIAKNIATLIIEKSKMISSENKEKHDDNKQ